MNAVVVPGNNLRAEHYAALAERLAERGLHARVLALAEHDSWDAHAQDVARAAEEHLGAEGGALVGHSMGGLIALLAAARRPTGLRRLVLVEPLIIPWRRLAVRAARRYVAREEARGAFRNWTGTFRRIADLPAYPEWALRLHEEARRTSDPAARRALFHRIGEVYPLRWEDVPVPTLLLRGAASGWRMRLLVRAIASRLPARVEVVPGAAHWMVNEADEALAARIAAFSR